MDNESLSEANDEMDNELKRTTKASHFCEIHSIQEIASGIGHAVTVAMQDQATGAYEACGVGTGSTHVEAQLTARKQFIEQLKTRWGLT